MSLILFSLPISTILSIQLGITLRTEALRKSYFDPEKDALSWPPIN